MNVLMIIISGIIIFIVFRLTRFLAGQYFEKSNLIKYFYYINLIELAVWTLFYFWAIDKTLHNKSYFLVLINISVILLVILVTWYYLKDLIAGILFKIQHHPQVGKRYTFDQNTGVIKSLRAAYLIIETPDGDEVQIPYSKIQGTVQSSSSIKSKNDAKINITTSKDQSKELIIASLKEKILYSPWTSFKKEPVVKLIAEKEDSYEFEITLNTLSNKHLALIEKQLKGK